MPQKAVVRQAAQTIKVRIVYDASAKSSSKNVSLNERLETGPPLQNLIWDILTRSRFRPILLRGDIEKAFLQIHIRESERDVLRFRWGGSLDSKIIEILRFTRLVFGLIQSPFILEGTPKHFENYRDRFEKLTKIIENDMYVDDLVNGGNNLEEVKEIKQKSVKLFRKRGFNVHKWNSNVPELESENSHQSELTYAKQVLNQGSNETKILGLGWNKRNDTLSVVTPTSKKNHQVTKRNILSELASVYDPTGLISPAHLIGKILYRDMSQKSRGMNQCRRQLKLSGKNGN